MCKDVGSYYVNSTFENTMNHLPVVLRELGRPNSSRTQEDFRSVVVVFRVPLQKLVHPILQVCVVLLKTRSSFRLLLRASRAENLFSAGELV